jgi:hypothetical protein
MSLLFNSWRAGGVSAFSIDHATRFRAVASCSLNRTPAQQGNLTTWTWSAWVKRTILNSAHALFCAGGAVSDRTLLYFNPSNNLAFLNTIASANTGATSTGFFRDTSAYYHIQLVFDTLNGVTTERTRLYANGVRLAVTNTATGSGALGQVNKTINHLMGRNSYDALNSLDGYLSEINFVDGQALEPSAFGETNADGVWVPKKYAGTYGTNGFRLDFSDGASLSALSADKSGNGNNWTANNISLTVGATYDWVLDTPLNNYATLNALLQSGFSNVTEGALRHVSGTQAEVSITPVVNFYYEIDGVSYTNSIASLVTIDGSRYNFGQQPFTNTPTAGILCSKNLSPSTPITMSGSFVGNADTNGPFVWLNGSPTSLTINGNAVTWGTHADKTAGGFKVRTTSSLYNAAGTNNYVVTVAGNRFGDSTYSPNRAQVNP